MVSSATSFKDPGFVQTYADMVPRAVPGYHDIHRMAAILIDEMAPPDARVLVLGAGGGLEIKALANAHAGWTFEAFDPAAAMLDLATKTLGPLKSRAQMHEGYIDDAPAGPYDAATSLLTLHFVSADERRRIAAEVHRRLVPGAPFVVAHLSFPQRDDVERGMWLARYSANLIASGIAPADAEAARVTVENNLWALPPHHDRAILEEAGFVNVSEFFVALTFRGWVGYA
jgi:tRNA (cmo5U34)-methyltransferase